MERMGGWWVDWMGVDGWDGLARIGRLGGRVKTWYGGYYVHVVCLHELAFRVSLRRIRQEVTSHKDPGTPIHFCSFAAFE